MVDVRLKPWSQQPDWRQEAMRARLGRRYVWIEDWGNLRYKDGPPVALKNWHAGHHRFRDIRSRIAVVLCGCRDAETCHRSEILARLFAQGYEETDGPLS